MRGVYMDNMVSAYEMELHLGGELVVLELELEEGLQAITIFHKNNSTSHNWIEIINTLESCYNMANLILLPRVQALVGDKLELLELGEGEELLLLARPYVEEHKGHYGHKGLHSH